MNKETADKIEITKAVVTEVTGVEWDDITGDTRKQPTADARALFCFFAWYVIGLSYGQIGKLINRDYATVLHSVKKVADMLGRDKKMIDLHVRCDQILYDRLNSTDGRRRVYISGAIAGHDIEERKKAFAKAERALLSRGYVPVNPFRNGVPQSEHWRVHMRADIRLLLDCDKIYLLRGWELSKGAKLELDVASSCGIEVMFE